MSSGSLWPENSVVVSCPGTSYKTHILKLVVYPVSKEIMRWQGFQTLRKDCVRMIRGDVSKGLFLGISPRYSDPARTGLELHKNSEGSSDDSQACSMCP